jgi:hypothetical protein
MTFVTRMAIVAAMFIGLSAPSAQAGYLVDLTQQGSDVVATGSGSIDLTGLTLSGESIALFALFPAGGHIITGPTTFAARDNYTGFTGPTSFGSGGPTFANNGTGDSVGILVDRGTLGVPRGYISDTPLSDTSTYDGATLASLGATPGRYEWTWGSGANQNFTLIIGAAVPESSTWAMMLLGFAGLCFAGYSARAAASSNLWVPW